MVDMGDQIAQNFPLIYLNNTITRLQKYVPNAFFLTPNDVWAM